MNNPDLALLSAKSWIADQGWAVEKFMVQVSDLQSCPFGFVNIDVICTETLDSDLLRSSRVLEVEMSTGKIETVLAARDPAKLKKMVDLEKVKVKTELMQAELNEPSAAELEDTQPEDLAFRSLLLEEVYFILADNVLFFYQSAFRIQQNDCKKSN